jgi:flagellar hook-associated protein 1 FlgK
MVSLLSTLLTSASALTAYEQVLEVTENNVANSSTPGYAAQSQELDAMPFDPSEGSAGGVAAGVVDDSRDQYAEQNVWQQSVLLGQANQNVNSLTALQSLFDISGTTGIDSALNNLFSAFSAWGQSPTDTEAQQTVIDNATDLASAFQQTASGIQGVEQDTDQQLQQTVATVNSLVGQLQGYNTQIMGGDRNDAGLEASVYSTLEQLSQYVDVNATPNADGSVTVLLGNQTPLLIGSQQYAISSDFEVPADATNPQGPPQAQILASDGTDITANITTGQLGALLNVRNQVLPSYIGGSYQVGDLNTMAQQFADCVNQELTSGNISDGPPAQPGTALFTYDNTGDGTNVASTLAVEPTMTAGGLAAIDPGPPEVANGIPLALAQLSAPQNAADEINGASFTDYYGNMASRIGSALSDATSQQTVQQSAVAQAQNLRQQASGVNLDEEAMEVVQFERAYQANAQLVTVLDQLTDDTISILSTTT